MGKLKKPETLSELKEMIAELDKELKYTPGRKPTVYEDEEKEFKRLWNNYVSRLQKRKAKKHEESLYNSWESPDKTPDKYGIRPIDERRYVKCFKSGWIGEIPTLRYVKTMTGLNLYQIMILQTRTGYIPYPKVLKNKAQEDLKYREEIGDIY